MLFFQLSKRHAFVLHDFCREKIQRQNRQMLIIQDEQATAGDGVEGLPFCIADGSPFCPIGAANAWKVFLFKRNIDRKLLIS